MPARQCEQFVRGVGLVHAERVPELLMLYRYIFLRVGKIVDGLCPCIPNALESLEETPWETLLAEPLAGAAAQGLFPVFAKVFRRL